MKRVYPVKEYCIGCKLCELACLQVHSKSRDLIIAYTKERKDGLQSCKSVFDDGPVSVSLSCRHCENPLCVASCIAGALTKDAEGRTMYDESKCVGCWSCLMACPYGAIAGQTQKCKIIKCDLCPDRETPACVEACPNAALVFEDREEGHDGEQA